MLGMVLSVFGSVDKLLERFESLECKNIFEADSCEISDSVSTAALQPGYGLRVKYGHCAVFFRQIPLSRPFEYGLRSGFDNLIISLGRDDGNISTADVNLLKDHVGREGLSGRLCACWYMEQFLSFRTLLDMLA
jgi:hypothetical protein